MNGDAVHIIEMCIVGVDIEFLKFRSDATSCSFQVTPTNNIQFLSCIVATLGFRLWMRVREAGGGCDSHAEIWSITASCGLYYSRRW